MPFFGNLGATEMILIMLVLLLVFGAKRLPELGSGLGKGIREFKKSMKDITNEVERAGDENREIRPPQPRAAVPPTTEKVARDDDYGSPGN